MLARGDAERLLLRDAVNAAALATQSLHLDRHHLPLRAGLLEDFEHLAILVDPISKRDDGAVHQII